MSGVLADAIPGYLSWLAPVVVIGIVVQFFWQTVVSVQLHRLAKQDRTVEGLEKRVREDAEKSAEERHSLTTKLVDERFRAMTHEVNNHVQGFTSTLDFLKARLEKRDDELDGLGERDHQQDLKLLQAVMEIKTHVIEKAASKEDLKEHQREMQRVVEAVNRHLGEQDAKLHRIEQRCDETKAPRRT
jgi:chromosome segregation ATPase